MKNKLLLPAVILLVLFVSIFFILPSKDNKKLHDFYNQNGNKKILCTTEMILVLVDSLQIEGVDTVELIPTGVDPHSYKLVYGDKDKFDTADIVFYNGLNLEHTEGLKHRLDNHGNSVSIGDALCDIQPKSIIYIDGQPDPHIWQDVILWMDVLTIIKDVMVDQFVEQKANIEKHYRQATQSLQSTHQEMQNIVLNKQSNRYLVTTHDAFNYFTRRYLALDDSNWQVHVNSPEGLSPESQLNISEINNTIKFIKENNVTKIFPEYGVNKKSLNKLVELCRDQGRNLIVSKRELYGDCMPYVPRKVNLDDYNDMMKHNINIATGVSQ
jgi:manganese/zinc/iron transport system substrate-binding protein